MGLADAGAHCGVVCDGGTPTFMLTHWTRDRSRGPKLPLEYVVRRQTQETAELYGLGDRGALLPGLRADINVIDYDHLTFGAARMAHDLPAGARRLVQKAQGYEATFVAGVQIVDHDEFTCVLQGQPPRGPGLRHWRSDLCSFDPATVRREHGQYEKIGRASCRERVCVIV